MLESKIGRDGQKGEVWVFLSNVDELVSGGRETKLLEKVEERGEFVRVIRELERD